MEDNKGTHDFSKTSYVSEESERKKREGVWKYCIQISEAGADYYLEKLSKDHLVNMLQEVINKLNKN